MFDLDYLITGMTPDEVDFAAIQDGITIEKFSRVREITATISSRMKAPIDFCWTKFDRKAKKLDFHVKRNMKHSADTADLGTLDSIEGDLKLLMEELEDVSRNI